MYGKRTVVHLANPKPGIEDALNLPFITKTEWIDGRLLVSLSDPDTENPILVRKLVEGRRKKPPMPSLSLLG